MSMSYGNINYDHLYSRNKQMLLRVGLWPFQDKQQRLIRTFFYNVVILGTFAIVVHQVSQPTFTIKTNLKETQMLLLYLCGSCCYYSVAFNKDTAKKLRERIIVDWKQVSCKEEFEIMVKYAKESEQFAVIITSEYILDSILNFFAISLITPTLFQIFLHIFHVKDNVKLTLPIHLEPSSFFDEYFYVMFSLEIVSVWTVMTIATVIYTSFLMCIKHSCSLLRVITFKISQPFMKVSDDVQHNWFDNKNCDAYEWMKDIVRRYKNATEYIDLINSLSEKMYMIEMFVAMLTIVINFLYLFQMYQTAHSRSMEHIYHVIMSAIYMGGSLMIIYMSCYIGQTLIDHGTDVLESFYQVSLYELPLKCQRVLPIMIMRSTKPCVISIGGLFMASHDFFAQFMNASMSYAMVCYNLR